MITSATPPTSSSYKLIAFSVLGPIPPSTVTPIIEYQKQRQAYYESLSTFDTFGRGWTRRVDETTVTATEMI